MTGKRVHKGYISMIFILAISLLLPSTVKLAHAFADHKHQVCEFPQSTHYHEYELDCDFYKFKINPQISFDSEVLNDITSQALVERPVAYYSSVKRSHVAAFRLRGPPIKI